MGKVCQGVVGVALAVLLAGCGKAPPAIVPAGGVVSLDGKPLQRVAVRFIPVNQEAQDYVATGVTDQNGRFQLTCKGQPGACAGDNHVLLVDDIPPELLKETAQRELAQYLQSLGPRPPKKYANLIDSPLKVTVTADQADYPLKLTP